MDFSQVESITIPEGSVAKIMSGGVTLWEKDPYPYGMISYEAFFAVNSIDNSGDTGLGRTSPKFERYDLSILCNLLREYATNKGISVSDLKYFCISAIRSSSKVTLTFAVSTRSYSEAKDNLSRDPVYYNSSLPYSSTSSTMRETITEAIGIYFDSLSITSLSEKYCGGAFSVTDSEGDTVVFGSLQEMLSSTSASSTTTDCVFNIRGITVPYNHITEFCDGKKVTSLPARFLYRAANADITINNWDKITSIGGDYCLAYTNYDGEINLSSLNTIPSYFLYDDFAFSSPITFSNSLTSIGSYFANQCRLFSHQLTLPSSLTSIGNYFLAYCYSFNKNITVPASVTSIGSDFLYYSGITSITVNTNSSPTDNFSLATGSNTSVMYTTGVTVNGSGASAWKAALPNSDTNPYRKLL